MILTLMAVTNWAVYDATALNLMLGVSHEDCPCHTPLRSRESLEAELALMKAIVPMTDSQRNALIEAIITIGDKLK